jgi:hypothetical protein
VAQDKYNWRSFIASSGVIAAACGVLSYYVLPDLMVPVVAKVLGSVWLVLGAVAALSIQIAIQLLTLGDSDSIPIGREQYLAELVDQRLRFLWDLTGVAVFAMALSIFVSNLPGEFSFLRQLVCTCIGLCVWLGWLCSRLPSMFHEIRAARWRLALEKRVNAQRKEVREGMEQPSADVPEVHFPDVAFPGDEEGEGHR